MRRQLTKRVSRNTVDRVLERAAEMVASSSLDSATSRSRSRRGC